MLRFYLLVVCGISSQVCLVQSLGVSQEADWEKRFREEAPKAWRNYLQRVRSFQYRGHVIARSTEVKTEFKQRGQSALRLREQWARQGDGKSVYDARLLAVNERYGFELVRSTPEGRWALARMMSEQEFAELTSDPRKHIEEAIQCLWIPCWAGIRDDVFHPNFTWKSVTVHATGQECLVRLDFKHQHPQGVVKEGFLIFDPENFWLLRVGEVHILAGGESGRPNSVRFEHLYTKTAEGVPLLRQQRAGQTVATYEFWEQPQPNEAEFRLSYYGFPEPEELRGHKPTPWWLYILLAGLALVMLSFAIYAWRRHRRAAFA